MSAVGLRFRSGAVATGTALKTIAQLVAASNHGVKCRGFSFSFQGTSNTDAPILCQVSRQSTAGTMSAGTGPVKDPDDTDETVQTTSQVNATAEPTTGDVLWEDYVHPQQGVAIQLPFDAAIKIGGGDRLGFRTTAGVSVNCVVGAQLEE